MNFTFRINISRLRYNTKLTLRICIISFVTIVHSFLREKFRQIQKYDHPTHLYNKRGQIEQIFISY